jgi:hypothetical protein
LNELLGAGDAGDTRAQQAHPKAEAVRPERALRTFLAVSEASASGADKLTERRSLFPKRTNATHAKFERAP